MTTHHLNQIELSRRWGISHRTLERWRSLGEGPPYLKIGGRVVYRQDDIERYEAKQRRNDRSQSQRTAQAGGLA
ncbi:MAG: helix-turn-helix domain-containing protein [Magnetococcales bacterium]|nr:helix-turn-helix domain-containing protein [Magnetococcales bacterium]